MLSSAVMTGTGRTSVGSHSGLWHDAVDSPGRIAPDLAFVLTLYAKILTEPAIHVRLLRSTLLCRDVQRAGGFLSTLLILRIGTGRRTGLLSEETYLDGARHADLSWARCEGCGYLS